MHHRFSESFFKIANSILENTKKIYESEKQNFIKFIPIGIGSGIYTYFSLSFEPQIIFSIIIFLIAVFIHFKNLLPKFISYFLFTFSLGFLCAGLKTIKVDTYMLDKKTYPMNIKAVIESSELSNNGISFIVKDVEIKNRSFPNLKQIKKLQLTFRPKDALNEIKKYPSGAKVLLKASLYPIKPPAFPGAYDFKKQRYFENISAQGFLTKKPKILALQSLPFENFRSKINRAIEANLKAPSRGLLKALITGTKSEIPKEIRENYAHAGIAHILAISGLHIGIIGFFVFMLIRFFLAIYPKISMYFDTKKFSAIISLIAVFLYLMISGASVPSIRAFIMHFIIIIAVLIDRKAFSMTSVAIAATIIMMLMPETIMFPSFEMSFSAVIALISFYDAFPKIIKQTNIFGGVILTTVIASLPTSLFSAAFFNQITVNGILANIIAVPLMSFILMPLILILLTVIFTPFSTPIFFMIEYLIQFLTKIASFVSSLPGSVIFVPTPSTTVMTIITLSSLWLMVISHKIRLLGTLGIALGLFIYIIEPRPDIFISNNGEILGVRNDITACFNNLKSQKSISNAWAKSIGSNKIEGLDSKACKSCVAKFDDQNYVAKIQHKKILISSDDYFYDKNKNFNKTLKILPSAIDYIIKFKKESPAQIFFADSGKIVTNQIKRPWS